jgi:hypothetical protein
MLADFKEGKQRLDEFLNMNWFLSLEDLQAQAQRLKMKTPKVFLESYDKEKYAV